MDIRKVKKLIELLESSGIAEIEIKEGEEAVRISRGTQVVQPPMPVMQPNTVAPTAPAPTPSSITPPNDEEDGHAVKSPMVGTFYAAPSPTSDPFVTVGSKVKKGDTLCIVEAMKIMNPIEADASGEIIRIEKNNAETVEYGDVLFVIDSES